MKINKEERIVVNNWFSTYKEISILLNKNYDRVNYLKRSLRKRFNLNKRQYLNIDQISYVLNNLDLKAVDVSKQMNINIHSVYGIHKKYDKTKSINSEDYMFNYKRTPWSIDEQIYIEQNYNSPSKEILNSGKVKRSNSSIVLKRHSIRKNGGIFYDIENNIIEWGSTKYIDFIRSTNGKLTSKEIADKLGLSMTYVYQIACKNNLNVKIKDDIRLWKDKEINILKKLYLIKTNKELTKYLNRSSESIRTKANEIGLTKNTRWSPEEIEVLRKNYSNKKYKTLAKLLNRTVTAITSKAKNLNLYKYKR